MDDEPYGQRIPTSDDIEAIAALLEADRMPAGPNTAGGGGSWFLSHTERNQIHSVLELYLKSFLDV